MGRSRDSWRAAMLVTVLALVAATAGTAIAGTDATTSALNKKKVKKIAKKQAIQQINALAPGLTVARAETAGSAEGAEIAETAANSSALQGKPADAFASSDAEPTHEIGQPGEPQFQNGWTNANATNESRAGFYKDPWGVVHLQGTLRNPTVATAVAFTLPQGYRPSRTLTMAGAGVNQSSPNVSVFTSGEVAMTCSGMAVPCLASIEGLTYRVP